MALHQTLVPARELKLAFGQAQSFSAASCFYFFTAASALHLNFFEAHARAIVAELAASVPAFHLFIADLSAFWGHCPTHNGRFQGSCAAGAGLRLRVYHRALLAEASMAWHIAGVLLTVQHPLAGQLTGMVLGERRVLGSAALCVAGVLSTGPSFSADCRALEIIFGCSGLEALNFTVDC